MGLNGYIPKPKNSTKSLRCALDQLSTIRKKWKILTFIGYIGIILIVTEGEELLDCSYNVDRDHMTYHLMRAIFYN